MNVASKIDISKVNNKQFKMSPEEVSSFQRDGFFVSEGALSPEEVDALNQETLTLCKNGAFTTYSGEEKGEAEAVPMGESVEETLRRYLCIHFPHKLSKLMQETLAHPGIVDVLTKVVSPNVKCMQSMLFIKASGKPGQAWHQDEDYIPSRDRSLIGAWIALDDATVENGCLWVIPGSQKPGVLWPQKWHADKRFDCAEEAFQFPYEDKDSIPVEVKAGSIVFFNGYLLHRSLPNVAKSGFRRALVNHYMSAESLLPWDSADLKVGVAKADFRDIVMVAGKDPYAYKGTQNLSKAHVRASGNGGCGNNKYNVSPGA